MKRRSAGKTLIAVIVSLVIVAGLIIAASVLRMNDSDIGFFEAMKGFLKDTFSPYSGA